MKRNIIILIGVWMLGCTRDPIMPLKTVPEVSATLTVTNITSTSGRSGGSVISNGGDVIIERGICWSTSQNPGISDNKIVVAGGLGFFTADMTNLSSGTTYYVRLYASTSKGITYGSQVSFTTLSLSSIVTTPITSITTISAISGGNITSSGGSTITARGICWSTSTNPTIALSTKTLNGTGTGSFSSTMTGLNPGTTYYVRAYATNSVGTSYGNQLTFTTLRLPTVSTNTVTNVNSTSSISGGNVSSDGGATVTSRGVCWSTSMSPTIALNTRTFNGSGTGSFTSSITGLNPGSTYYVRAYATNSAGTAYGNELSFTTLSIPVVSTNSVTNITTTSAISGGNVTSSGGTTVTSRGICWSTSINPTIALSTKTLNGSGPGTYSATMTGLSPGTTYYVRAYATNSVGTAYGSNVSFRTN